MSKKLYEGLLDELRKLYIDENQSLDLCCSKYGVSRTTMKVFLREHGIKKDSKMIYQLSKRSLENKYGEGYCALADRAKVEQGLMEKYGVRNPMQNKDIRKKAEETNLRKYGTKSPLQNKEVFNKMVATNLERFGTECVLGNATVKAKALESCRRAYGNQYPLASSQAKEALLAKRKQTNIERYGTDEITKSTYFRNLVKERNLKKYGVDHHNKSIYSDTIFKDHDSCLAYIEASFDAKPTIAELKEALGVSDTYLLNKIHAVGCDDYVDIKPKSSHYEKDILEYLVGIGIPREDIQEHAHGIAGSLELDLYIEKLKLAIEFNGTYWHSSIYKDAAYHQMKSSLCEDNGIRLIHIYEYEWVDETKRPILESILRMAVGLVETTLYARKCSVSHISMKEAKAFLNENHLQGFKGSTTYYGLFYEGSLYQVMSFTKKQGIWEIAREATKKGCLVVGGTSKLYKAFVREFSPTTVFSYCDYNKFTGNGYLKLGMTYSGLTVPDMKWIIDGKVYNRNPTRHSELKEKADAKIFGAGSKKYIINYLKDSDGGHTV